MTTPAAAVSLGPGGGRGYPVADQVYPSVTEILKAMSAPALERWKINLAAEFAVQDHIRALANDDKLAAKKLIAGEPYVFRAGGAADLGTRVHAAVEAEVTGIRYELDPEVKPFVATWAKAVKAHKITFVATERTCFSHAESYAGTFDAIVKIGHSEPAVLDYKTGKRVWGDVALQLAAYANAEGLLESADGRDLGPMVPCRTDKGLVMLLHAEKYELIPVDLVSGWHAFKACRSLWNWQKVTSKRALGRALVAK